MPQTNKLVVKKLFTVFIGEGKKYIDNEEEILTSMFRDLSRSGQILDTYNLGYFMLHYYKAPRRRLRFWNRIHKLEKGKYDKS